MLMPKLNDPHDYKILSFAELHRMKSDPDIRQEHRSYAEAEIERRQRKRKVILSIVGAIASIIAASIPFIMDYIKKIL